MRPPAATFLDLATENIVEKKLVPGLHMAVRKLQGREAAKKYLEKIPKSWRNRQKIKEAIKKEGISMSLESGQSVIP